MRVAVMADIHGNPMALEAALNDIQAQGGVDGYWVLGDMTAIGYDPASVLERLTALPNVIFIRGNADRYVIHGEYPKPTPQDLEKNLALLPTFTEVQRSFAWTQGYLAATGWLDWLAELPLELRLALPDGSRALLVHASPGRDDEPGLNFTMTDDEMRPIIAGGEAELVLVGHTHWPFDRLVDGIRVLNPGSISNPFPPDLRASYLLLEGDSRGCQVEFRRAAYDHQAVIEAVRRVRHPGGAYIIAFQQGRVLSSWLQRWQGELKGESRE